MWQSRRFLERDLEILHGHAILYRPYLNLIPGEAKGLSRFYYRVRKTIADRLQRWFHLPTQWAISYSPGRMYSRALKEEADLYSAHLECAFYAGRKLMRSGKKVSFDFEDWYSRDYLVPERPVALLKRLEKFALEQGVFCTAASQSMAEGLKDAHQSNRKITVIYNGFPRQENPQVLPKLLKDQNIVTLLWFSRTIGPERGIEFLLQALAICKTPVELHLLGEIQKGYRTFLEETFCNLKEHTLIIHPFMLPQQLPAFISQFDIGLAIEEDINDNKRLTVSNKILQYLQEGLTVLASDTKGQREVASLFPTAVIVIDIKNTAQFAAAIEALISKEGKKANKEQAQKETYMKAFLWEAQEEKLEKLLEDISWE